MTYQDEAISAAINAGPDAHLLTREMARNTIARAIRNIRRDDRAEAVELREHIYRVGYPPILTTERRRIPTCKAERWYRFFERWQGQQIEQTRHAWPLDMIGGALPVSCPVGCVTGDAYAAGAFDDDSIVGFCYIASLRRWTCWAWYDPDTVRRDERSEAAILDSLCATMRPVTNRGRGDGMSDVATLHDAYVQALAVAPRLPSHQGYENPGRPRHDQGQCASCDAFRRAWAKVWEANAAYRKAAGFDA